MRPPSVTFNADFCLQGSEARGVCSLCFLHFYPLMPLLGFAGHTGEMPSCLRICAHQAFPRRLFLKMGPAVVASGGFLTLLGADNMLGGWVFVLMSQSIYCRAFTRIFSPYFLGDDANSLIGVASAKESYYCQLSPKWQYCPSWWLWPDTSNSPFRLTFYALCVTQFSDKRTILSQ